MIKAKRAVDKNFQMRKSKGITLETLLSLRMNYNYYSELRRFIFLTFYFLVFAVVHLPTFPIFPTFKSKNNPHQENVFSVQKSDWSVLLDYELQRLNSANFPLTL